MCNRVSQEFDLCGDAVGLGVLCFCCFADVGCQFCSFCLVGDSGAGNFLDVLSDLVAYVGHLVCAVIACFADGTATVLGVCFKILYEGFEVPLGFVVVVLDEDGLVFSCHHFCLVKAVRGIVLLEVELELVLVADDDAKSVETVLVLVKIHAECSEVHVAGVPVHVEFFLQDLPCLDIKWAPSCVEMVKDLDCGCVAVGGVDVLEL